LVTEFFSGLRQKSNDTFSASGVD
jgi:hypothetical protein